MGQQQLLLVVLGIVIVGIALAFSITLFRQNAAESKRDVLIDECSSLATQAMAYYKRPSSLGGGSKSFTGWDIPQQLQVSANGSFSADVQADKVIITGTGNEVAIGSDSIKVKITVLPGSYSTEIVN